jgi:uncharacterized membrane protein
MPKTYSLLIVIFLGIIAAVQLYGREQVLRSFDTFDNIALVGLFVAAVVSVIVAAVYVVYWLVRRLTGAMKPFFHVQKQRQMNQPWMAEGFFSLGIALIANAVVGLLAATLFQLDTGGLFITLILGFACVVFALLERISAGLNRDSAAGLDG